MYPFLRLFWNLRAARRMPSMGFLDSHVSQHRVRLVDCDIFGELNNGRILTLYEFGRFQAGERMGLPKILSKNKWGLAVAGSSIRYRKRLLPFEKFEMRSRILHWDERFIHFEQGMFKTDGTCANHLLIRTAVVAKGRAVPTRDVLREFEQGEISSPEAPAWAKAWMEAEAQRPWPPMQDPEQDVA